MASVVKGTAMATPDWLDKTIFPFQSYNIDVLGHQIHYIDSGNGPTLLLLHGNGSWSFGFRRAIPLLSQNFRVVALDYPGFGLSRAKENYSFKPIEQTAVVESFVEALQLTDIRLFVEDWGGPIGLGLAGRRPELIHSLFISNTWAWPAQGMPALERFANLAGGPIGRFLITRFNILEKYLLPNINVATPMSATERAGYYMPYPTQESRIPQTIFPHEILASHEYLAEVEASLQKLAGKPVLLIWGEKDSAFGVDERSRFQNVFPYASTVLLPEAKHFVMLDEPQKSADAILNFENKRTNSAGNGD